MESHVTNPGWEEIEHTADWALRIRGDDLRTLFENAARGMVSLLGDVKPDEITFRRTIELSAMDLETLLVDWLTELLYALDDGMIFSEIIVRQIEGTSIIGEVSGGPTDQPLLKQIKAVTYHMLEIKPTDQGFEVVIVFDV
jgi:SHS2 domain-containing protein